jgi:hypothetical protein
VVAGGLASGAMQLPAITGAWAAQAAAHGAQAAHVAQAAQVAQAAHGALVIAAARWALVAAAASAAVALALVGPRTQSSHLPRTRSQTR